jgi:GcrA cell cycle regulator
VTGWTNERVEMVTKLWREGYSASQCAKQLGGVTRNAVIGKVTRLGLPKRPQDVNRFSQAFKPVRVPRPPKPPKLRIAGGGMVFEEAVAPPPRVVIKANAFDALPETAPQPWEQRGAGCNWPIGDGLSCCEPVHKFGWCAAHHAAGRVPFKKGDRLERALRRHIA